MYTYNLAWTYYMVMRKTCLCGFNSHQVSLVSLHTIAYVDRSIPVLIVFGETKFSGLISVVCLLIH